ncbi:MAG: toprim domain-containing protein [Algoriphagus sp.]|nr:toprim domain-containing protein [Algoriphagus sp.]
MNYSEIKQKAARIKQEFSVLDYFQGLVKWGCLKYEGIHGKEHFFGYLEQRTGSIAVDDRSNVWYDHAAGLGGDIFRAVQVFENKSFVESVERLSGAFPVKKIIQKRPSEESPKIIVKKVTEISHDALINYIKRRGLDLEDIKPFAKEVHWRNKGNCYFAIGFPNESGGWVLRSSIFKGNILGGGISIQILGTPSGIKIFEGWFDFLSYLKLSGAADFKAVILNSTANLSFSLMLEILKERQNVELYLDNDPSGEKNTISFIKIAMLHSLCLENGLETDFDINTLKGNIDNVVKLIDNLENNLIGKKQILDNQSLVSDERINYRYFKDLNDCLKNHPSK